MSEEKIFQPEVRTDEDAKKLNDMLAAGWKIADQGVFYDVDFREPPRAFYQLFKAESRSNK